MDNEKRLEIIGVIANKLLDHPDIFISSCGMKLTVLSQSNNDFVNNTSYLFEDELKELENENTNRD